MTVEEHEDIIQVVISCTFLVNVSRTTLILKHLHDMQDFNKNKINC